MSLVEPEGHIRSHFLTLIHTPIFNYLLKTFLPSCLVLMKIDVAGVLINLTQCWAFVFICSCESTWFKARCSPHEDHSGRDSCLILVCMCGRERERKWQITLLITLDRATKDLESKTRKDRYVGGVALRLYIWERLQVQTSKGVIHVLSLLQPWEIRCYLEEFTQKWTICHHFGTLMSF